MEGKKQLDYSLPKVTMTDTVAANVVPHPRKSRFLFFQFSPDVILRAYSNLSAHDEIIKFFVVKYQKSVDCNKQSYRLDNAIILSAKSETYYHKINIHLQ